MTRITSRLLVVYLLSFAGFACGSSEDDGSAPAAGGGLCANETRGQSYAAGLAYEGEAGLTVTLADSNPAPPQLGDNVWTLEIADASGVPVLGARVKLKPLMVDHGHGSASTAVVTDMGEGTYRAEPVNLSMPGFWNTTIEVTAGAVTDDVQMGFCVE